MRTTDTDQILMQRFQEGDDSAFTVLVHKYQGLVLSLCRRYLGSRAPGVEDVAQEVFVRVFKARMTYEPRAKVKTWIYSITVNACLNEIRRLRSKKNRSVSTFTAVFGAAADGEAPDVPEGPPPEPTGGLEGEEAATRVRAAVDALVGVLEDFLATEDGGDAGVSATTCRETADRTSWRDLFENYKTAYTAALSAVRRRIN